MIDKALQGRIAAAMQFFTSHGWTVDQSAGIVANLWAESRVDHTQAQIGGGPGYGLAQWEGPRQRDFVRYAGHDIRSSTFIEQCQFIAHELDGTQAQAGHALKSAVDAADAGAIVCRFYERPADTAEQSVYRAGLARKVVAGWPNFDNVTAGVTTSP